MMEIFIDAGVDPNTKNAENKTFLEKALEYKSYQMITFLVEKGANVDINTTKKEPFLHSVLKNEELFEILKFLVKKGANVNSKSSDQKTPLDIALTQNSFEVIKFLVENGADINGKGPYGASNFETAIRYSSIEVIELFVKKGANIKEKTIYGETYINFALEKGSFEILKILVENGADVNEKSGSYYPLEYSLKYRSFEFTEFLVRNGAKININDYKGIPLFLVACKHKSIKTLNFLVENGADVFVQSKDNENALHFAMNRNQLSLGVVKFLAGHGIDFNLTNSRGETPLCLAITKNHRKIISFLLMNNADISYLKDQNYTKDFLEIFSRVYSINHDLNNLLISDYFFDFQIQSNDSSKFNVHKLILLTRFDNDNSLLQKFINVCNQKSQESVKFALSFLYTGFLDFETYAHKLIEKNQTISYKHDKSSVELQYKSQKDEQILILEGIQKEKERKQNELMEEFFKEVGLDSNWIESKRGRKGILKDFHKLYLDESTKDFTIICSNGKEIKIHRFILIIRSELYKGMFALNVQDKSNQVHDYSGKSFETLNELVYFFYHDEINENRFTPKIIEEFEDVEDYFQLNQNSILKFCLENLEN
ncbi:ankyrin repeat family protein [Anaeramoeba ignava]|uniref:Ankyrin repeat family protein n=1 Tax=Anaeramoeba ignava TaxID=1746090 RepID=A0A9Q0L7D8_ANAIG|nr:ankyrin repeat family protein [Anaeramoeba ignava]